jgi:hypothetical protein
MNRRVRYICLTLAVFAVLGLAVRGRAQQLPQDQVPIKLTIAGLTEHYMIPITPAILSWKDVAAGEVPALGHVSYIDHAIVHLGADGKPVSCTDGVGAFTSANGDDLFITFSGLIRPSAKPDVVASEGAFTATGGRGRFKGATGSGAINMEMNVAQNTVIVSLEGTISAPKP